jgi:hypothetical protein
MLAWLAGLLEGEGCFIIRDNGTMRITLDMTDEDVVRRAHKVSGMGHVWGPVKVNGGKCKDSWRLNICYHEHVYALCAALYPFMGVRRKLRITEMLKHSAGRFRMLRKRLQQPPKRFIPCGPSSPL